MEEEEKVKEQQERRMERENEIERLGRLEREVAVVLSRRISQETNQTSSLVKRPIRPVF